MSMNRRVKSFLIVAAAVAMFGISSGASAATEVVNGFGVGGWTSWDTRSPAGTQLVGTNDTNAAWPGTHTSADDASIEKQIIFMGEGQTTNAVGGEALPPSPTGSLNGLGYVRLDGTDSNSGKSDISYVNTSGIAPASDLTTAGFGLSYEYYIQRYVPAGATFRTVGLNISLLGTDSHQYTFAYVQPTAVDGWNNASVANSSGLFSVFSGSQLESGATKTLTDWAADPTFGAAMFGTGAEIFRVGFNIGSGQKSAVQYMDSLQTSLLNGGDTIDFQGAVPEPTSLGLLCLGGLGMLGRRRRARA